MTPEERRQQVLIEEYKKNVGKPPETCFPDDPDWQYMGTKEEREALEQRVTMMEDERALRGQEVFVLDE